ncbi:ATP-dependent protease La (LON) domain protein [Actinidia rufa]|uniref:ATP-dependent protease La (LON) domain protein n=1 Tax=Actinidia rufa TaxID=165716 RepID=A0A7J0FE11_9ERIC|nr:ATP-dependent protease La (LON) domain protein [Actinidia rufa]
MEDESISETERHQREQILELESEELQIEEVDDLAESSDDDETKKLGEGPSERAKTQNDAALMMNGKAPEPPVNGDLLMHWFLDPGDGWQAGCSPDAQILFEKIRKDVEALVFCRLSRVARAVVKAAHVLARSALINSIWELIENTQSQTTRGVILLVRVVKQPVRLACAL